MSPSSAEDSEALRRAGEMGFATLIMFAANACCGLLVFLVPITGGIALWQARGLSPRTEVDRLWQRIALTGGWLGVVIGTIMVLVLLVYVLFFVAIVGMGLADPSSL